jgi:RNA polymerase sigma-70 factor (ECF subfamily)
LLEKLRQPTDTAAWDRFVDLYTPLLFCWACKLSMNGMEPADFVQDVFVKLVKFLPKYQHDPAVGSFRGWLRTMCMNHWRDHKRKAARQHVQATDDLLAFVPTRDDDLDQFWDWE